MMISLMSSRPFDFWVGGVDALRLELLFYVSIYPTLSARSASNECWTYLVDIIPGEWGVGGHEEMTTWCRDQTGDDSNQIIIHITRISQRRRRSSHHRRHLPSV
jgi:hypothetical protein